MAETSVGREGLARSAAELAHALIEGADVSDALLELLRRYVGADVATLSVDLTLLDARPTIVVHGAPPLANAEAALWMRLLPDHPYARYLATGPTTASRMTDHLPDHRSFWNGTLYRELLSARGMRYQAAATLERRRDVISLACLWRSGRDFRDSELETIEVVRGVLDDACRLKRRLDQIGATSGDPTILTPRRVEVLTLVSRGLTNDQIGRRLGISTRTVRKHLEILFARSGATSRTALAVWWRQGGASATSCGVWPGATLAMPGSRPISAPSAREETGHETGTDRAGGIRREAAG